MAKRISMTAAKYARTTKIDKSAELIFTIVNTSAIPTTIHLKIECNSDTEASWLSLRGDEKRKLAGHETEWVTVRCLPPEGAVGRCTFKLVAYDAEAPKNEALESIEGRFEVVANSIIRPMHTSKRSRSRSVKPIPRWPIPVFLLLVLLTAAGVGYYISLRPGELNFKMSDVSKILVDQSEESTSLQERVDNLIGSDGPSSLPKKIDGSRSAASKNRKFTAKQDCFNQIQGNIAWNYEGDTKWRRKNLKRLCGNTNASGQPGNCFRIIMHGKVNWGEGTRWNFKNAIDLCQGTNNASETIGCFIKMKKTNADWQSVIKVCQAK